uniref:Reverse transcriptase RNase H-like domain-containing protein n=1 Tax=Octopus bimaculoides TaxID=37653 RepID=A0A0L8HIR9_OCTBM
MSEQASVTLAVCQENVIVAYVQLQQMCQDQDEPIRVFAACLQGQSGVCHAMIDYSDIIVRDALVHGLGDEICLEILGDSKQDMTLEEVLRYIEAKESGKCSASWLINHSTTSPTRHHLVNRSGEPCDTPAPTPGNHCGKHGYRYHIQEHIRKCPTYNHKCATCGILHHYESVQTNAPDTEDHSSAICNSLCLVIDLPDETSTQVIILDHHVYNELCNGWVKCSSNPHPFVTTFIQADPADTKALGFPTSLSWPTTAIHHNAMADTGCQSCLAEASLQSKLGLDQCHLMPVNMTMTAANSSPIDIIGALTLRISGTAPSSLKCTTRQIIYTTPSTDKLFLFHYCVTPQGYVTSGDSNSQQFDEIVSSIPQKMKCINDTLMWSNTIDGAFFQAIQWLNICGSNSIILNPTKFDFAQTTIKFAGFEITPTTVRPCAQYIEAICDFPTPKNITDIHSWFSLINQVFYTFTSAKRMLPFQELFRPGTWFVWTDQLNRLFEESKSIIINEIQRVVESRYTPVEGEALAVTDALDKACHFTLGCTNLIVAVDHKPLLKVFEKTLWYNLSIVHVPGTCHAAANTVSHHPNQVGPNPTKWDKTGVIIEYMVRRDGSGQVTLHNRNFHQKYLPIVPCAPLHMAPGPPALLTPTSMMRLPSQPSLTAPLLMPQAYPTCPLPNTKTTREPIYTAYPQNDASSHHLHHLTYLRMCHQWSYPESPSSLITTQCPGLQEWPLSDAADPPSSNCPICRSARLAKTDTKA